MVRRAFALPPQWSGTRHKLNADYPGLGDFLEGLGIANLPNGNPNLSGSRIQRLIDGQEQFIAPVLKVLNPNTQEGVTVIQIDPDTGNVTVVYDLYVGSNIKILQSQGLMAVQAFGFMHVWGAWEGAGGTAFFEWIGPDIAPSFSSCATTNAYYYRAVVGGALQEGGSGSTGLNFADQDSAATEGTDVTITHPSAGGTIVVTMGNSLYQVSDTSPGPAGTWTTQYRLYRDKASAGEVLVDSPTSTGTRVYVPAGPHNPFADSWIETETFADTYTDPDTDTDTRVFRLEIESITGSALPTATSTLTIGSNEA
jgi:hypothetical protein